MKFLAFTQAHTLPLFPPGIGDFNSISASLHVPRWGSSYNTGRTIVNLWLIRALVWRRRAQLWRALPLSQSGKHRSGYLDMQQFKKVSRFLWETKVKKDIWERGRGDKTFASVCQGEERMDTCLNSQVELHYQSPTQTLFYLVAQHQPYSCKIRRKFFMSRLKAVWIDCVWNKENLAWGLFVSVFAIVMIASFIEHLLCQAFDKDFHISSYDYCYYRQSLLSPSQRGRWASAGPNKFLGHTFRQWQSRKLN